MEPPLTPPNVQTVNMPEKEVRHDYEEVLKLIGFGKTQWILLIINGLFLMMVINETMSMSIINIASQCDFATTSSDKAILSSASFLGILLSSYFWGYFSDKTGRRAVLLYSTFGGNIVSFISMFSPYFWLFVVLRFIVGIIIAGASSTTYAYLSEFFILRHRPLVINYASMFVGISLAYFPAVAWLVLMMDWQLYISASFMFRPWRLLMICNLLPGFIAALVLLKLPESPKILMGLHKEEEAMAAVNWICRMNTGKDVSQFNVYKLKEENSMEHENLLTADKTASGALKRMWTDTLPLFRRPHVLNFIISCIVMCGLFCSSSGMGLWYPEIQNRVSASTGYLTVCQIIDASIVTKGNNNTGNEICNDKITDKSYIDAIIFGVFNIVGYIILGIVINPLGRKLAIILGLFLSALCSLALQWILHPIAIVCSFCLFMMLPGLCVSVLGGAVVDLVPTILRGKAVCICLMLGRSGSIIGTEITGTFLESYCSFTFSLFSASMLVCAALTFILPI